MIGYEVDKVRAAVDWFTRPGQPKLPIGVAGSCEGGVVALYAAAADPRIDEAYVGSYYEPREAVWKEPICRNVWGLLEEFGDAEIASLITPRTLTVAEPATGRLSPAVSVPPCPAERPRGCRDPGGSALPIPRPPPRSSTVGGRSSARWPSQWRSRSSPS